jgi:hypothetical protein
MELGTVVAYFSVHLKKLRKIRKSSDQNKPCLIFEHGTYRIPEYKSGVLTLKKLPSSRVFVHLTTLSVAQIQ